MKKLRRRAAKAERREPRKSSEETGFPPEVLLDLSKETRREVLKFFEKVEQCGRWPQQACRTMFILILKNVTSERPIALLPTLIRW